MALFSGKSARNTGIWAYNQAQSAKQEGQQSLTEALNNALSSISSGRTSGLNSLGQGYQNAASEYEGAISRLDPYEQSGRKANSMYENSLGLNGASGNSSATSAFQESPGYKWQTEQSLEAVKRNASSLGSLGSGNTMAALQERGNQLANQEYGNWQNRLSALGQQGQQAATSQAGLQSSLGNLYAQQGQNEASLYSNAANQEAGLYGQFAGLGQNNLWNATNSGINSVTNAGQQAKGNVMSGVNFGINSAGSLLKLLGLGT